MYLTRALFRRAKNQASKMAANDDVGVQLGRPGNHLKMGVVGIPNVGKSTLFNCLCKLTVAAENYPFCTIDPNESRVEVPDARWEQLCDMHQPKSRVPAFLHVTDIAGLIAGASEGAGLGNAFLSHIRAVDGIFHVTRVFEDDEVVHVDGEVDPVRDLATISEELLLKDIEHATNTLEAAEKACKSNKEKRVHDEAAMARKIHKVLAEDRKPLRFEQWNAKEVAYLNTLQFLTAKPVIYLVNMSERDYARKKNKWLKKIFEWVRDNSGGEMIIPFSGVFESTILSLEGEARDEYIESAGCESALAKIITSGYEKMNLIHYFTAGPDEVKCWTIRKGTKAPGAAGVIHTDFERGFICAEVMAYEDFIECGSEAACKAAGKYLQKGKDYVVADGDICFFKFNVSNSGKKSK